MLRRLLENTGKTADLGIEQAGLVVRILHEQAAQRFTGFTLLAAART
ncbi:hypothetical protein [Puniceibacterium confluentis]